MSRCTVATAPRPIHPPTLAYCYDGECEETVRALVGGGWAHYYADDAWHVTVAVDAGVCAGCRRFYCGGGEHCATFVCTTCERRLCQECYGAIDVDGGRASWSCTVCLEKSSAERAAATARVATATKTA